MLGAVAIGDLLQVIWVSLVAGVSVTAIFSVVIYAGGRSGEARRAGNGAAATGYVVLAVLAFALFIAVVVVGVTIMLHKD